MTYTITVTGPEFSLRNRSPAMPGATKRIQLNPKDLVPREGKADSRTLSLFFPDPFAEPIVRMGNRCPIAWLRRCTMSTQSLLIAAAQGIDIERVKDRGS